MWLTDLACSIPQQIKIMSEIIGVMFVLIDRIFFLTHISYSSTQLFTLKIMNLEAHMVQEQEKKHPGYSRMVLFYVIVQSIHISA